MKYVRTLFSLLLLGILLQGVQGAYLKLPAIRGAIWYQGESNQERAIQYRSIFPGMIQDWRSTWKQGEFPFYFVQLAKEGELSHFEIAGEDQVYHPAKAIIDGATVVVCSQDVTAPVAVRFAWGNTDEPNLFNKEGLPASSFCTDTWKRTTDR